MKTKTIICLTFALGLLAGGVTPAFAGEKEKEAKLEAKAKVSKADAEKTALGQVPGGTVKEAEIEKEHGKLVWSFDITTPGTTDITEVNVDAMTGALVNVEKEKARDEKDKNDHEDKGDKKDKD